MSSHDFIFAVKELNLVPSKFFKLQTLGENMKLWTSKHMYSERRNASVVVTKINVFYENAINDPTESIFFFFRTFVQKKE